MKTGSGIFTFFTFFSAYHNYEQNMAYVLKFKQDYPTMVDIEEIGKTLEGRPLIVVKVHSLFFCFLMESSW
jgi:hypothetical protein